MLDDESVALQINSQGIKRKQIYKTRMSEKCQNNSPPKLWGWKRCKAIISRAVGGLVKTNHSGE